MRLRPTTILGLAALVAFLATPSAPARACEPDATNSCCATANACICCPAETTTAPNSPPSRVAQALRPQSPEFGIPASRPHPTVTHPPCLCRDDQPSSTPTRPAAPTGSRPSDDRTTSHADVPAPPTAAGPPPAHAVATTRARPPDIPAYLRFASLRC